MEIIKKKYKLNNYKKSSFTTSQVENKQHHGFVEKKHSITILLKMPD